MVTVPMVVMSTYNKPHKNISLFKYAANHGNVLHTVQRMKMWHRVLHDVI